MQQHLTIEPIRWMSLPSQVSVHTENSHSKVYFQILTPMNMTDMCIGRPVEELPRILTILSSSHHLVSAMALDRLFKVEPPPLAVNVREGLLCVQYAVHHLRKVYFLLCARQNPFDDYRKAADPETISLQQDIMHHLAICQEAAAILGGRADHPITAIAGGVSRFLKEVQYKRLADIADACSAFAPRLKNALAHRTVDNNSPIPLMKSLRLSPDNQNVILNNPDGSEADRFPVSQTLDRIALRTEPWTYMPFAEIKHAVSDRQAPFWVGPAARQNSQSEIRYSDIWSFYAEELIQATNSMKRLFTEESLTGPEIRTIPSDMGNRTFAGIEAPEGFLYHDYQVDDRGIVQNIFILDASMSNNAFRCRIAETIANQCLSSGCSIKELKTRLEMSLLPF